MGPNIDNRIATGGGDSNNLSTTATKKVIADAARSSAQNNWTHRHLIRTDKYNSIPCNTAISVRSTRDHYPVLIGSNTISSGFGISGSLQVEKENKSTPPDEVRNAKNWTLPLLENYWWQKGVKYTSPRAKGFLQYLCWNSKSSRRVYCVNTRYKEYNIFMWCCFRWKFF